jgi:hypothetical protein
VVPGPLGSHVAVRTCYSDATGSYDHSLLHHICGGTYVLGLVLDLAIPQSSLHR